MTVDKLPKPAPSFGQIVVRTLVVIGGLVLLGVFLNKKEKATTAASSDACVSVDRQTWQTRDPAILDVSIVNDDQSAVRNIAVSCAFFNAADAEIASSKRTIFDSVDARSRRLIVGVNFGPVKKDATTVSCHVTKADRVSAAEKAMTSVEIRGVRLRMLPTELPAEFRQLRVMPSPILPIATQGQQCDQTAQGKKTCLTIFFDGTPNGSRVYAVLLEGLRLGAFDHSGVAEEVLAKKYGPPKCKKEETDVVSGTVINLSWNTCYSAKNWFDPQSIILKLDPDPNFGAYRPPGLSVSYQGDILLAGIFQDAGYYAKLVLMDLPAAVRMKERHDENMKEQRDAAAKEELKRAKPDRF
jgi:hypothetical protein